MTTKLATVTLTLLLLGTLAASPAAARKSCRRLCRDVIRGCITEARGANPCAAFQGKQRRECRRNVRVAVKACKNRKGHIFQACLASPSVSTCSPSGAFVDPA